MTGIELLKNPFFAQLEITDKCNFRCEYCYHFDIDNMPSSTDLSDEKILQIVQKMIDLKFYSLVLTGGEPLIRPETLIKVVKKAKTAGMYVSINTNLLLLTPKILAELRELKVDSFLVSCPASEPSIYRKITKFGDYDKFSYKLKMLLNSNISCLVNMVVTQTSYPFIRSTAKDLVDLGVKRFSVTPACLNVEHPDLESLLTEEQTIALFEDLRWCVDALGLRVDTLVALPKCFFPDWWWKREDTLIGSRTCQAGRMSVNISNVGDVRPCPHNPIVYGNLFKESMEKIWKKMDVYRNNSTIPAICKNCPTVDSCRGACRTNALAVTNKLNEPDRLTKDHIKLPEKSQPSITFKENSVVNFEGKLRWRKELNDCYSITSNSSSGNLTIVNEAMFDFVCWLEKSLPLTVKELTQNIVNGSFNDSFIKIFEIVVRKKFVTII